MTDTMTTNEEWADSLAKGLPTCNEESEMVSLCDLVITGIDSDLHHFKVTEYDHRAGGRVRPWAILWPLRGNESGRSQLQSVRLFDFTIRQAVYDYAVSRLRRGMSRESVEQMIIGAYTDDLVCDSILQFALYGQEVYT